MPFFHHLLISLNDGLTAKRDLPGQLNESTLSDSLGRAITLETSKLWHRTLFIKRHAQSATTNKQQQLSSPVGNNDYYLES
jgi:hypothetical protein